MSDERRLSDRAGKLASAYRPPAGPRELAVSAEGDVLGAVLREIDETVLPRSVQFLRGKASIRVSAANRRLISVDAAEPDDDIPAKARVIGQVLTRPDISLLGQLREVLTTTLSGKGPLSVLVDPPTSDRADFAAGTTAASLASAWGVELLADGADGAEASGRPLDAFFTVAPSLARAWVRLTSGSVTTRGGEPKLAGKLSDFAASSDMADLDLAPSENDLRLVAIGRAPDEGDCLLFLADKQDSALLLVPAEALETVRTSWRDVAQRASTG